MESKMQAWPVPDLTNAQLNTEEIISLLAHYSLRMQKSQVWHNSTVQFAVADRVPGL